MKKFLLIGLGLMLSCSGFAQLLHFAESYKEAFVQAREQGKQVLVYAYTPCIGCERMNKNVLAVQEVADLLNSRYILVDMDLDEREGVAFRKEYEVKLCPSFYIFGSEGNLIHKVAGECSLGELPVKILRSIAPEECYTAVKKRYDAGERSVELFPNYLFAMEDAGEIRKLMDVADEFFKHFTLEQKVLPESWAMFDVCVNDFRAAIFQDFLTHKAYYTSKLGEEPVNEKIRKVVLTAFGYCLQEGLPEVDRDRLLRTIEQAGMPEKKILGDLWKLHNEKDYAGIMGYYEKNILTLEDILFRSKFNVYLSSLMMGADDSLSERQMNYTLNNLKDIRAIRAKLKEQQPAAVQEDQIEDKKVDQDTKGLQTGDFCPDYSFEDINGKEVALKALRGKYVLIDIWATWCPPCRDELPYLKTLEKNMEGRNICFVSISCDSDKQRWKDMVNKEKLGGMQLYMGDQDDFMNEFGNRKIPRFVLLDPQGKIVSPKTTRPSDPATEPMLKALTRTTFRDEK